jgi:hypothetical protein
MSDPDHVIKDRIYDKAKKKLSKNPLVYLDIRGFDVGFDP